MGKLIRYINICLLGAVFFFIYLVASSLNYGVLVDPIFYIEATQTSASWSSALQSGTRWVPDYIFIFLSFIVNKISINFDLTGLIFVIVLHTGFMMSAVRHIRSSFFSLLILSLMINPSYVGMLFNIWRQGLALAILLMGLLFMKKRRMLFFGVALFTHFTSIIFFIPLLIFSLISKKIKNKKIKILSCIMISVLAMIFLSATSILDGFGAYTQKDGDGVLPRLGYSIFIFFSFFLCINGGLKEKKIRFFHCELAIILLYILLASLVFCFWVPGAALRFLHYFIIIFPLAMADIYRGSDFSGKLKIVLICVFHIAISFVFLIKTQTWSNLISATHLIL